jgi:hypothetical protein
MMQEKRKPVMPQILSVLFVAVVIYLLFSLYVFVGQSRFVYYPDRRLEFTPAALKMTYENLRIKTGDGETLGAWFVPAEDARGTNAFTVLHFHGNGGDMGDRVGLVRTFHDMGMNVLIFDYRGYGESTGTPGEEGTYRDAEAVWEYLTAERGIPPLRIILHGQSLGGSVASWLASRSPPGMLVLESTFTAAPDMAAKMFPFLPVRLVCRFKYDSLDRVARMKCPVLIAHGPEDEMIPFSHGQRLFAAAPEPKLFVKLDGSHNAGGLEIGEEYRSALSTFAEKHLR